jgi:hypothetical protein
MSSIFSKLLDILRNCSSLVVGALLRRNEYQQQNHEIDSLTVYSEI